MITLAILFALTVLAPLAGLGPPLYRGAWARNGVLYVVAPPREAPDAKATEAHEVIEWWCAWVAGCLAALPVALFVPGWIGVAAVAIAAVLGNALARKASLHFDYVGHNVGWMLRDDREAEITRMIERGDQHGMTRADVSRRLKRWQWVAKVALFAFQRRYGR
jgi:hypothetical protein